MRYNLEKPIYSLYKDDPVIGKYLQGFSTRLQINIDKLDGAIKSDNEKLVRDIIHELKGVAGQYGYPEITQVFEQIETEARKLVADKKFQLIALERAKNLGKCIALGTG